MPRNSKFDWNATNTENFEKTIRNFNAKIYRQRKVHPELTDILPNPITKENKSQLIENLNDEYVTQHDFERQMRSLKRFSNRDATKIVEDIDGNAITNWQKKEIQYKVNTVNQKLKKQREEVLKAPELKISDKLQLDELEPIDTNKMKNKDWEKFSKALDKKLMIRSRERAEKLYKQRFLEKIEENLNGAGDELYDFISRIPEKVLYDARFQEDKSLKIQFVSDPLPADQLNDLALNKWRNYLNLEEGETYEDLENKEFIKTLEKKKKGR